MEIQITNITLFIYVIISMVVAGAILYFIGRYFTKKARTSQHKATPMKDKYHS